MERYQLMKHNDLEANHKQAGYFLHNDVVQNLAWADLSVRVKHQKGKGLKEILTGVCGTVHAGELLAIMGPSGCGKTTLLNSIARRRPTTNASTTGAVYINDGVRFDASLFRKVAAYVEQEDALIGSLTVLETVMFAAGLTLPDHISDKARVQQVLSLIEGLGLREQMYTIVGTPLKKGLSGGQKKRLSIASQLVASPKILLLDEPTSGLDSAMSFEVIRHIRTIAKENNLIVVATIHQPSSATLSLFDKLCLMSKGQVVYHGPVATATKHFSHIGFHMPAATNPGEFYLDLINDDVAGPESAIHDRIVLLRESWTVSLAFHNLMPELWRCVNARHNASMSNDNVRQLEVETAPRIMVFRVLLRRSWIKARRDLVTYHVRIAMYLGLALMMGTVFFRFKGEQKYIQSYINAIFFGGAFMSFMAVAYVPAYIEDYMTFSKERSNGLVGPGLFMLSNFLIGMPFLFLIAVVFSITTYFLIGFHSTGASFFIYVLWLFLDLLAAESLVVLVSSILPNFVMALAITAFANGLWMCVDGFLVPMTILNSFWKYVFHYIDYQAYVFQGMMVNEMAHRTYACDVDEVSGGYACQFPSRPDDEGLIDGVTILNSMGIATDRQSQWLGIMIVIILVYRILGYLALRFRKVN